MKKIIYIGILGILLVSAPTASAQLRTFISGQVGSTPVDGYILQTNGTTSTWVATSSLGISGGSSQWVTSGSDIYYNTGNVGIGTSTAALSKLYINGTGTYNGPAAPDTVTGTFTY
jgi:hypothetical protein